MDEKRDNLGDDACGEHAEGNPDEKFRIQRAADHDGGGETHCRQVLVESPRAHLQDNCTPHFTICRRARPLQRRAAVDKRGGPQNDLAPRRHAP